MLIYLTWYLAKNKAYLFSKLLRILFKSMNIHIYMHIEIQHKVFILHFSAKKTNDNVFKNQNFPTLLHTTHIQIFIDMSTFFNITIYLYFRILSNVTNLINLIYIKNISQNKMGKGDGEIRNHYLRYTYFSSMYCIYFLILIL